MSTKCCVQPHGPLCRVNLPHEENFQKLKYYLFLPTSSAGSVMVQLSPDLAISLKMTPSYFTVCLITLDVNRTS